MARIAVIGDGPAGLSAALFLARGGHDTVVFGDDDSLVEYAEFHNYLGVPGVLGTEFMDTARDQAADAGARLRTGTLATAFEVGADSVGVRTGGSEQSSDDAEGADGSDTSDGGGGEFDYVVVAGGKASQALVADAGATVEDGAVVVDGNARTSLDRVYAAGHLVRPDRSQAIISAGMGAAAALDILSREAGADVHDWDSPS
ncbi:MAG TPA: FAD-dependent oxidoreductase [Nitriliruptoraceae bacterium]|nr:FAD-dependent oxidoreductase [Nitriliruptoraceae bacterium]